MSYGVTLPGLSVGPDTGGGMMKKPYGQFLADLEKSRGLPDGYLARTRAIESANGTNLRNPNSSAKGDFQFIDSTARSMGLTNPMDPYASATAAADLAAQNSAAYQKRMGQAPTGADLYGMHQQGSGGYLGLLAGNRTSDDAMRLNGGAGLSGTQMVARIHGLYDKAKPANLGEGFMPPAQMGANAGQGPTIQNAQAQGLPTGSVAPTPPDNSKDKFTGGLFGLAQGDDYSGAGRAKDMMGKLGDIFGDGGKGSPIGGAIAGLTQALGGGQQQQSAPAPLQPLPDLSNTPNMQYLQMLMARRGGMGGGIG